MFKKIISLLLSMAILSMSCPVLAFGETNDVKQIIPLYHEMEKVDGITVNSGTVKLIQDRKEGKYAVQVSTIDIQNSNQSTYRLVYSSSFDIAKYSQLKLWVKPGQRANWIKFSTNGSTILSDKNSDGVFSVGSDLISGQWNLVCLNLNQTQPIVTQGNSLTVTTNDYSVWSYDQVRLEYSPTISVSLGDMASDQVQNVNNSVEFKKNSTSTYNVTPTLLTTQKSKDFAKTYDSVSSFNQGTLSNLSAMSSGSLSLKELSKPIVAAGMNHTVLARPDGSVWAWGENSGGQLGDNSTINRNIPAKVQGLSNVKAVGGGWKHSIALKNDGTVWAWGDNSYGQLGDGTKVSKLVPSQVPGLNGIVAISAGNSHSLALKNDGTVWAWGYNWFGQVGNAGNTLAPIQVPGLSGVVSIAAGSNNSFAIQSDGTLWAWGYNLQGQLGDGGRTDRSTPVKISGISNIKAIAPAQSHTIALKSDGTVWVWGSNQYGQQAGTTQGTMNLTPFQVPAVSSVNTVRTSLDGTCYFIREDGSTWGWGNNINSNSGFLFNESISNTYIPIQITALSDYYNFVAGDGHMVALKKDGTVWSLSQYNTYGQMGTGPNTISKVLTQINSLNETLYVTSGSWVSNEIDLSSISGVTGSSVTWNSVIPSNSSVTIQTNLYNYGQWQGWKTVTSGNEIPEITSGVKLQNGKLQVKVTMSSPSGNVTPQFSNLKINIAGGDYIDTVTLPQGNIQKITINSGYKNIAGNSIDLFKQRVLLSGVQANKIALSGDGSKVYFNNASDGNKVYLYDLYTGTSSKVADLVAESIKTNKDGTVVAFRSNSPYVNGLYVYTFSNQQLKFVTANVNEVAVCDSGQVVYAEAVPYSSTSMFNIYEPLTMSSRQLYQDTIKYFDAAKDGSKIYYSKDNLLCVLENTPTGWKSTLAKAIESTVDSKGTIIPPANIEAVWTNANGSLAIYTTKNGLFCYQSNAKAVMKLDKAGTIMKILDNNQVYLKDQNEKIFLYDLANDKSTDIRPSDALNNFNFGLDDSGEKMIYTGGSGLTSYYPNGIKRPEKYLLSFDGKNTWLTCKKGIWTLVKSNTAPTVNEYRTYGMTVDEINALTDDDFQKLYENGQEVYTFDVGVYFCSTDPYITPSLKSITVTTKSSLADSNGQVIEKALYTTKVSSEYNAANWRQINRIYPIELQPKEAETYYFVYSNGLYYNYSNNQLTAITNQSLLFNVENNWIDITLQGLTADQLRNIPPSTLNSLLGKKFQIVYTMKVLDLTTEPYNSMITVDYVDKQFADKGETVNLTISLTGEMPKTYTLDKEVAEQFMQWVNDRQNNKGPVFYRLKTSTDDVFINYYMLIQVKVA